MSQRLVLSALVAALFATPAFAGPSVIAVGSLSGSFSDLSGLSGTLENGATKSLLGGMGSGLAWAGGSTFLALPDRGPNASDYTGGTAVDKTTSYIDRFHTVTLQLNQTASGSGFNYSLTPALNKTTLLYSATPLSYGSTSGLPSGTPSENTANKFYFTGRSDGFGSGTSLSASNARFDPEAIRVSADGRSVFVSDEYGPYVYQFDRRTGERIRTYDLPGSGPGNLGVAKESAVGATEISANSSGRVANKGMEGLAITPDGKTLVGFMQSALLQDGGDGKKANRIVTIDVATGATKEYAYNNAIGGKSFNSSEILAVNDHQFLVLERDGKGLGDGSSAAVKQVWAVDLAGAEDISGISGEAALLAKAPSKKLFLDLKAALNAFGITDDKIPAKLEGMAFGEDIIENGSIFHTLYVANDNDFASIAGDNQFFVFKFADADLTAAGVSSYTAQSIAAIPEPESYATLLAGLGLLSFVARRRLNR